MSSSKPKPSPVVAIIQHPPVFLNLHASLEKAASLIEEAARGAADVIVFPETWLPGYPVWLDFAPKAGLWDYAPAKALYRILVESSISLRDESVRKLSALAKKTGAYIVMGAHEQLGGTLYNSMLFLDRNGRDVEVHRKLMPTYTERLIWGRGDGSTLSVLQTQFGAIGGLICWEHWMPLARAALHAKHEMLHVAQWPMVKENNLLASRHYAFEGQCFVAAAGCVLSKGDVLDGLASLPKPDPLAVELLESMPGEEDDLLLKGGSAVIAPDAEVIAGPVYDERTIVYAKLDIDRIKEGRLTLDTDGHYARPDVFRLEVNDEPQLSVGFKSGKVEKR